MILNRSRSLVLATGLACVLGLSACQERATRVPYIFQITPDIGAAGSAVSPTSITPVTDPAVPRHLGVITVNLQGFLNDLTRKRRVLATVADIFYVTVTVKAADGSEFSKTVEKAAITNGQTTATFSGLAVGDATVTMKAFDVSNRAIGSTTKTATIAAGQNTAVDISLTLDPTYTGGSGGGTSSTGSLTTNATISDGPVINGPAPATSIGSFQVPELVSFTPDQQGNLWGATEGAQDNLVQFSPAGAVLSSQTVGSNGFSDGPSGSAFAPDGSRWLLTDGWEAVKYAPAGQEVGRTMVDAGGPMFTYEAKVAADGALWFLGGDLGLMLFRVAPDAGSSAWILGNLALHDFDFDPQGNVWAVGSDVRPNALEGQPDRDGYVYKLSAAGSVESRHARISFSSYQEDYSRYKAIAIAPSGQIWFTAPQAHQLLRLDPATGAVSGPFFVGWAPQELVFDVDGRLWVTHRDGVSRVTAEGQVAETVPIKGVWQLKAGASGVWGLTIGNGTPDTIVQRISH